VHPLEVGGGGFGYLHAGPDGAGDRDHLGCGVLDKGASGVPVAADDVEDALGQELRGHLGEHDGRDRRGVARLQDDGVARGYRGRELPDRHHHRVVPRRDLRADAHRLAADDGGVPFQVLPGRLTLQHARRAGEKADLVRHRRDLLLHGEPDGLAGVLRLGADQLLRPLLYGVGEPEQGELPFARGRVAPRLEGPLGHLERPVDVGPSGDRGLREGLARGRVDEVGGPAVAGVDALPADEVLQPLFLGVHHELSFP
jgi:hypothetical protein